MRREVLITLRGLLFTGEGRKESDYIDVITPGEYFFRDGRHYLIYNEMLEGCDVPIRNRMTITPDRVTIRKQGVVATEMDFSPDRVTHTYYGTPYGSLDLSISTRSVDVRAEEDRIQAHIRYHLMMGDDERTDCFVKVLVQPRQEDGGFRLRQDAVQLGDGQHLVKGSIGRAGAADTGVPSGSQAPKPPRRMGTDVAGAQDGEGAAPDGADGQPVLPAALPDDPHIRGHLPHQHQGHHHHMLGDGISIDVGVGQHAVRIGEQGVIPAIGIHTGRGAAVPS